MRSATPSASAPPLPPSPMTAATIGTGRIDIVREALRDRRRQPALPRSRSRARRPACRSASAAAGPSCGRQPHQRGPPCGTPRRSSGRRRRARARRRRAALLGDHHHGDAAQVAEAADDGRVVARLARSPCSSTKCGSISRGCSRGWSGGPGGAPARRLPGRSAGGRRRAVQLVAARLRRPSGCREAAAASPARSRSRGRGRRRVDLAVLQQELGGLRSLRQALGRSSAR